MSIVCTEGLCPGPQNCWLRSYLEKPAPTPPDVEADDVNAARRMTGCPIRDELRQEFPGVFSLAEQPPQS